MHVVDISIVIVFLVVTLYVGLKSGKKIKTFSDYAIGDRKFSDFAIFCTVAATVIGGSSTIGAVGKAYEVGIIQFLGKIGGVMAYLVVGIFFARRFSNYYGYYSIGDVFYKSYGTSGKILVGIVGSFYEIVLMSLQFTAIGTVISVLTGLSYMKSLLITVCIILMYTGRGGIRAVTFTDVLQLIVLIVAFPILLITILGDIGGLQALVERLPKSHMTFSNEYLPRYLFLTLFILPTLAPHHIQRLLVMKNGNQGVKAYKNTTLICLFLAIVAILLGLTAKVLLPGLEQSDKALLILVKNYLPVGIFGVAVIGILAVLMSTTDSYLNAGSIMLVNDVMSPYVKYKNKEFSDAEKLRWARRFVLFIGLGTVIFASLRIGLFELAVLVEGLWFPTILVPLYFLLFNMKIPFKYFLLNALIGFLAFILWDTYVTPITKIDGIFPGFFANVILFVFFYFRSGRQKVFTKEELAKMRRAEAVQNKKQPSIRDLQVRNNIFLGLCLVFLQLMPLVFERGLLTYSKLMLTLVNGTMAILLIFGNSLELFANEKRFQWLKLTALFFCLPLSSSYLLLTSQENGLHILTLVLSFVVMLLSIEEKYEKKMVIICGLTTLITVFFYQKNDCVFCWPETFAWQHSFYIFGYIAVLFLLRSCSKIVQKEKELMVYRERYLMARSLSHDMLSPLMALHMLVGNKKTIELDEKESQLLKNIANEIGSYIDDFIVGGLKKHVQLRLEDLNQCVFSCIEKQTFLQPNFNIQLQAKERFFARVDAVLLRRIINNLLKTCMHALQNGCNTIVIAIDHDSLGNTQISLQAANGGFSAKALNSMFIEDQKLGDEVDLGISFPEFQDIVAKWHGKLEIISHNDNAIIQILLPNENHDKFILKA